MSIGNSRWLIAAGLAGVLVACGPADEAPAPASDPAPQEDVQEPEAEPGATVFHISREATEARFVIDEVLEGADNAVVGATSAVEGEITVDLDDVTNAQVSTIRVDLSTLQTDSSFRDRALRDFILSTGSVENQYAVFEATAITGLPRVAEVGSAYPVTLRGNLTIGGTTTEVTFQGIVAVRSATELAGEVSMSIPYESLGVKIPRLPERVASVSPDVTLEMDFVALAK